MLKRKIVASIFSGETSFVLHTIYQTNKVLIYSFLISILCVLNYESYFIKLIWINKFTVATNNILVQILYAYITGFIFYFFIELLPRNKQKISLFRFLNNRIFNIQERVESIISQTCKANNIEISKEVSREEFLKLCNTTHIHFVEVNVWFYSDTLSLHNFILRVTQEVRNNLEYILVHIDLFDEKWINNATHLLDGILNIEKHLNVNGPNSTLNLIGDSIWDVFSKANNLDDLLLEYYKRYNKIHTLMNPPGSYASRSLTFLYEGKGLITTPNISYYKKAFAAPRRLANLCCA